MFIYLTIVLTREIYEDKKKIYGEVMNSNILQRNVLITSVIYVLKYNTKFPNTLAIENPSVFFFVQDTKCCTECDG